MRAFIVAVTCWAVVMPATAFAQSTEAEALRRELEELRRQQEQCWPVRRSRDFAQLFDNLGVHRCTPRLADPEQRPTAIGAL